MAASNFARFSFLQTDYEYHAVFKGNYVIEFETRLSQLYRGSLAAKISALQKLTLCKVNLEIFQERTWSIFLHFRI